MVNGEAAAIVERLVVPCIHTSHIYIYLHAHTTTYLSEHNWNDPEWYNDKAMIANSSKQACSPSHNYNQTAFQRDDDYDDDDDDDGWWMMKTFMTVIKFIMMMLIMMG